MSRKDGIIVIFILFFSIFDLFLCSECIASSKITHKKIIWEGNEVNFLVIPKDSNIKTSVANTLRTVPEFVLKEKAIAGINGGYFNHRNGFPVSNIVVEGILKANPDKNMELKNNPVLKPVLSKIINERVEFRILNTNNKSFWEIKPHSEAVKKNVKLVYSLQAGPKLLPSKDLVNEGFLISDKKGNVIRDGISSQSRASRSAIGITDEGNLLFVIVSKKYKGGITINQLAKLMKHLGSSSAMALDGGSSTTLTWKSNGKIVTKTGSGNYPAMVNSVLLVFPKGKK